ncbi:MAG: hypothetical protein DLM72_14510 [Candidatus Nitrosopolaris wilkensis]|nr:MAG: hypothetical protein DLM72_14510 [Candidatus Nitrosopolaris wilkensis]
MSGYSGYDPNDGSDGSISNIEKLRKQREPGNVTANLFNQQKETFVQKLATLKGPLCPECHRDHLEPYLIGPNIKSKKWIVGLWYWQCPRMACRCRLEDPIEGQITAEEDELIPEDMADGGNDNHTFILSMPDNRRSNSRRRPSGVSNENLENEDLEYFRSLFPGRI